MRPWNRSRVVGGGLLIVFMLLVGAALYIGSRDVPTQFKVTAETELVQFTTDSDRRFRLDVTEARVSAGGGEWQNLSEILEPAEHVIVMVSRIGSGSVSVDLLPEDSTRATAVLQSRGVELKGEVTVVYPPPQIEAAGQGSVSFYFTGRSVRIGQESNEAMSGVSVEMLRTGTVELLGRSRPGEAFQAGEYGLGPGDMVGCEPDAGCAGADTLRWTGVIVADGTPALHGVFMTRNTELHRYRGTETDRMRISFIRRLLGDPRLALLWVALAFLGQIAAGMLVNFFQRYVDTLRGEGGRS